MLDGIGGDRSESGIPKIDFKAEKDDQEDRKPDEEEVKQQTHHPQSWKRVEKEKR